MKWGVPAARRTAGPRYLVVNADESEPGTCKDIPLMMATPHAARSRASIITVLRDRLQPRLHLPARRGRARLPPPAARGRGGLRRRATSATNILGSRLRPRHHRARRRRRLHLRRGDRAARLPRGPPRPAAPEAAVPRRRRPLRPARPWSTTSSRSPPCPPIVARRRRLVHRHGHREVHRLRHLLASPGHVDAPRPVRGAARHHAARAARHGRRHARPATS